MKNNTFFSKFHQSAAAYSRKFGWHVFPLRPESKMPLTPNGHLNATTDMDCIAEFWRSCPRANIGIALKPSCLLVLDLDSKVDQEIDAGETLGALELEFGKFPTTPHVLTAGGGYHFYFQANGGSRRKIGIRPGIDILGDGYVVAPPSVLDNGREYHWESTCHPTEHQISPAPTWLTEMLADQAGVSSAHSPKPQGFWIDLLENELQSGTRNVSIAKIAGHLLRRWVDIDLTLETVKSLNRTHAKPPLPEQEVIAIVDSIAGRELKRRAGSA